MKFESIETIFSYLGSKWRWLRRLLRVSSLTFNAKNGQYEHGFKCDLPLLTVNTCVPIYIHHSLILGYLKHLCAHLQLLGNFQWVILGRKSFLYKFVPFQNHA